MSSLILQISFKCYCSFPSYSNEQRYCKLVYQEKLRMFWVAIQKVHTLKAHCLKDNMVDLRGVFCALSTFFSRSWSISNTNKWSSILTSEVLKITAALSSKSVYLLSWKQNQRKISQAVASAMKMLNWWISLPAIERHPTAEPNSQCFVKLFKANRVSFSKTHTPSSFSTEDPYWHYM